ncbi:MAG: hypothetical protein M3552_09130 [Planctomycetota bacterium]|nr:hypothetical protein [Planctomycetaceae bacterium]MDQ3330802.1 hypothetical protein [Planctomycetota bacterium]
MATFQINIGDHTSSVGHYKAFSKHSQHYSSLKWARNKLFAVAKHNPPSNTFFRSLPGGRSLTSLINDSSIWVNYAPTVAPLFGQTKMGAKEIGISDRPFVVGKWMVLATVIHELAHVNGAPATGGNTLAEEAVYHCGLGSAAEYYTGVDDPSTPYDPALGD